MEALALTNEERRTDSRLAWPRKLPLLGAEISLTDYAEAVTTICYCARHRLGGAVAATSIHGVMLGTRDPVFGRCLNELEMAPPDGQGVRWALNLIYQAGLDDRVYGPELTLRVSAEAARQGLRVYLFGSTPAVAGRMRRELERRFPGLMVVGVECPSAWPWAEAQDAAYVCRIRESGAQIVFVGLGCPRQELWVHSHRARLDAVLVAVGAAFDFISGEKRQAPAWAQRCGLEMVFRTCMEPRRLWRRFLFNCPAFVVRVTGLWFSIAWRRSGRKRE